MVHAVAAHGSFSAAAESQLEALAEIDAGRLRLGSFPTASATLTPLAIAAFAEEYPGVDLRLVEGRSRVAREHCFTCDALVRR